MWGPTMRGGHSERALADCGWDSALPAAPGWPLPHNPPSSNATKNVPINGSQSTKRLVCAAVPWGRQSNRQQNKWRPPQKGGPARPECPPEAHSERHEVSHKVAKRNVLAHCQTPTYILTWKASSECRICGKHATPYVMPPSSPAVSIGVTAGLKGRKLRSTSQGMGCHIQ
jgi:hypothetical protein